MSLFKQLWLAIAFLMFIAFSGSFSLSMLSAKRYLEEQLYRKNIDSVSSLALLLSNEAKDNTMISLFIRAQYDTGHYQFIRLVDGHGNIVDEQSDSSIQAGVPRWFKSLFPIEVEPGIAQVSSGWHQIGTLSLNSNTYFAYLQLWKNSLKLLGYFLCLGIFGCLIGSRILKKIIQPLHHVVFQAKAIGERQFITTAEPKTLEFRNVVVSMNKLSMHVKSMLEEESLKLERWRQSIQHDEISGLLNRQPCLRHLDAFLNKDDESTRGSVVIIRICELSLLNEREGRETADVLLKHVGNVFNDESKQRKPSVAGRLNGSDFILISPGAEDSLKLANKLYEKLEHCSRNLKLKKVKLTGSCTIYQSGESSSAVLTRLDAALAHTNNNDKTGCVYVPGDITLTTDFSLKQWRIILADAFENKKISLAFFPVNNSKGNLLHWEAPARLRKNTEIELTAGHFMPYISRLEMNIDLDLCIARLALDSIKNTTRPTSINLSAQILTEKNATKRLVELIKLDADVASLLWLEIPEYAAFSHLDEFKTLCQHTKALGCKVGIEHIAHEVEHIGELHDIGLDFVKIDQSLIESIDSDTAHQIFLQGLCTMIHSIGPLVIAEGVQNQSEWKTLTRLGFDGGTGKFFNKN